MSFAQRGTKESIQSQPVKQFTIFLQNRVGALCELVKLLSEHSIFVLGLSVQDSSEYAILRIVVSDPEATEPLLKANQVPYSQTDLIVVEMKDGTTSLTALLAAILMAEVNIYFSYSLLVHPTDHPALALHVEDYECVATVLHRAGFKVLAQADLSR